tara:strand:+ start:233 stop:1708 length:1476 start_codon:yes stop_codon:yes gene_type:complete
MNYKYIFLLLILIIACEIQDDEEVVSLANNISVYGTEKLLYPSFENSTKHYAVNTKAKNLSIRSNNDADIYINGKKFGNSEVILDISKKTYDDSIIITFTKTNLIETYYVHIIDESIPNIDVEVYGQNIDDGFLIFSTNYNYKNSTDGVLFIVNNDGVPVFRRKVSGRVTDFKQHNNGMYSYASRKPTKNSFGFWENEIVILDNKLNEVKKVEVKGLSHTDNHDFLITDNSYILLSYHSNYRDLSNQGLSANELTRDSVIQEISSTTGDVILEWNSYDHMNINDCLIHRFPDDYAHVNSISLDSDNNIIASFRGCSTVLKIHRKTGNVIWSAGGSDPTLRIVDDPYEEFCGQHTANVSSNGFLTIFDNGGHCNGDRESNFGRFSRALKYKIDMNDQILKFHSHYLLNNSTEFYSKSGGSFFELRNGNWLVNWARGINFGMTEIDPNSMSIIFAIKTTNTDKKLITNYRINRIYDNIKIPLNLDNQTVFLNI